MLKHLLALAACASLALGAADAQAMRLPDLSFAAGSTSLVDGDPGGGGLSGSVSAMWAADAPWTFGLMVFADDLGTDLAPYQLLFEAKTHESESISGIYDPIYRMVREINEARDDLFERNVSPFLDLPLFMKYVAIQSALAEWDGLLGYAGLNNFYLYRQSNGRRRAPPCAPRSRRTWATRTSASSDSRAVSRTAAGTCTAGCAS